MALRVGALNGREQIGGERGNATLARKVVAQKSDFVDLRRFFHGVILIERASIRFPAGGRVIDAAQALALTSPRSGDTPAATWRLVPVGGRPRIRPGPDPLPRRPRLPHGV